MLPLSLGVILMIPTFASLNLLSQTPSLLSLPNLLPTVYPEQALSMPTGPIHALAHHFALGVLSIVSSLPHSHNQC